MAYLSEVSAYGRYADTQGKYMKMADGFDFTIMLERREISILNLSPDSMAHLVVRVSNQGEFEDMVLQMSSDDGCITLSLADEQAVECIHVIDSFHCDDAVLSGNMDKAVCSISAGQPDHDIVLFVNDFFNGSAYNGYSASVFHGGRKVITMSMDFVNDVYTDWHPCNDADKSAADLAARYRMIDANAAQPADIADAVVESVFGRDRSDYIEQIRIMTEYADMPVAPLLYGQAKSGEGAGLKSVRSDLKRFCGDSQL